MLSSVLIASALLGAAHAGTIPQKSVKRNSPSAIVQSLTLRQEQQGGDDIHKRTLESEHPYEPFQHLYVTMKIGPKKEEVDVALDSGSPFTWVTTPLTKMDDQLKKEMSPTKSFYSNTGFTRWIEPGMGYHTFEAQYVDGTYAGGPLGTASIEMNGHDLGQMQFGTPTLLTGNRYVSGVLGVSPPWLQSDSTTFLSGMRKNKVIASPTLSLYINSDDMGEAIWGGIDTTKFSGVLQRFDLAPGEQKRDKPPYRTVPIKGLAVSVNGNEVTIPFAKEIPAAVDSGSFGHRFPKEIADRIAEKFSGMQPRYFSKYGLTEYPVACSFANSDGSFDVQIGDMTIKHQLSDFVMRRGVGQCLLSITGTDNEPNGTPRQTILGAGFFKSAYLVFDDKEPSSVYVAPRVECQASKVIDVEEDRAALKMSGECPDPAANGA